MRYHDFELLIGEKGPGGYHVRVLHSPAGQAEGTLTLDPGVETIRAALERLDREEVDEALLKEFGHTLFQDLFAGEVRDVFHRSLGQVRAEGAGLRLRLRIEPPQLSSLPWEYLYDQSENFFLATSPEILISRYIQIARPLAPLLMDLPLRVLVAIASPADLPRLDVEKETEQIQSALASLLDSQQVELDVLRTATRREIQARLQDKEYHVFHFVGHGDFVEGRAFLALIEEEGGAHQPMDAEDFSLFFLGYRPMRLIVLNACKTAETATERAFVGMASHLVGRGIPAVIAMRYAIPDRTALLFSEEFYKPLAKGFPVDTAVSEARRAILQDVGRDVRDFGIPVLFMRAKDGVIVEFHPQKREQIVTGTQDALLTLKGLLEEHALDNGLVALDELEANLAELVKLNAYLLEWIELSDLLRELDRGLIPIYDETERKQPTEMNLSLIGSQWRLWKDSTFVRLTVFARGIRYIGEPYEERDEARPQGPEWMTELVTAQRTIDQALRDLSLRPLQEHLQALHSTIGKHQHLANRRLQETARAVLTLSNELLRTVQR